MLYKITHFNHIFYMTTTHSYAHLQTNNELSCPSVFTHVILSVWNAFDPWETSGSPLASSWNAISSVITSPPFPFARWNKLLLWKLPVLNRYFSVPHLTLEQLFMPKPVPGWQRLHLCILALLTMPSTEPQQAHSRCSVNMCRMDIEVMSVRMTGFLKFPGPLNTYS